jgi:NAD(P)-dependent dehydrogenase (short-subunit alcohol dehydrogenase family)
MRLEGKTALVTGGASGIGAAIAAAMCRLGAEVAVLDRDAERADDGVFAVQADVTDTAEVDNAVHGVIGHFGRVDVLVNNAGIGAQGTMDGNDLPEWRQVLDVNLLGMVRVTRACLPYLRGSSSAAIVNTASVAGEVGLPNRVLYSASKGAVIAASRAMAADLVHDGIRVCWVSPGTADTPWISRLLSGADDPAAERAALEARQPHGRLVSAQEVADAVCYLASPRSGSTTGVGLIVDGGLTALRLRR